MGKILKHSSSRFTVSSAQRLADESFMDRIKVPQKRKYEYDAQSALGNSSSRLNKKLARLKAGRALAAGIAKPSQQQDQGRGGRTSECQVAPCRGV